MIKSIHKKNKMMVTCTSKKTITFTLPTTNYCYPMAVIPTAATYILSLHQWLFA